jgi:hypothetical protein
VIFVRVERVRFWYGNMTIMVLSGIIAVIAIGGASQMIDG